jgi:AraC-like DNA-binding protein
MWLWVEDPRSAIELKSGEVALVRGGPDHFVAHKPAAACLPPAQFKAHHSDDEFDSNNGASVFLCGAYALSGDIGRGLLEALPPVLCLSAGTEERLQSVIGLLSSELVGSDLGQQTVLDRLLDILLVLAIRTCFQQDGEHAPKWFQASADPRLGRALAEMHADAAHAWTVPELASISGLSRAGFARAFQLVLGQAPMQYLTDWRMTIARDLLRAGELSLAEIGSRTGYTSPYAFGAAFRRHHGTSPGQWRHADKTARLIQMDEDRIHATSG